MLTNYEWYENQCIFYKVTRSVLKAKDNVYISGSTYIKLYLFDHSRPGLLILLLEFKISQLYAKGF